MEQFLLLLVFLVFALGSHLMRLLRKRMEERAPPPREARLPEGFEEEELAWPWPQEPPPLPEEARVPREAAPPPPLPSRRATVTPREPAAPAPPQVVVRGPRRRQPRLSREEARRGIVLREILGPCRGLEGMGSADRGGGA
jgi:hypothetical protein